MILPSQAVALITAAGVSSRMGRPKALLPLGGRTLLEYQCDQLRELDSRWVVLGSEMERIVREAGGRLPERTITLNNVNFAQGRGTSIELGACSIHNTLRMYGAADKPADSRIAAILICGVDQPVNAAVLQQLLGRFEPGGRAIVLPVHQGRRGHPLLLAVHYIDELCGIAQLPDGLRGLLRRHQPHVVEVDVDSPEIFFDLNTPQDYERFRARFGSVNSEQ